MRYIWQSAVVALVSLPALLVAATPIPPALTPATLERYEKSCDGQWSTDYQQHSKHIGKVACVCVAQTLLQYSTLHHSDEPKKFAQDYAQLFHQASEFCVSAGVLENTVERASVERISDGTLINGLCNASWVGVMRGFHPDDSTFNSKKLCQCANDALTQLVINHDDLSPHALRDKSLGLLKQCSTTPNETLSSLPLTNALLPAVNKGKFSLEIKPDSNPDYNDVADYLRQHDELHKIVMALNQSINLPFDIHIVTGLTNIGPYYDRNTKTITLDYRMLSAILAVYDDSQAKVKHTDENRWHYFNNVTRFLLYHELGHALIDTYHLPVLGQEEDAADALGAIIALNYVKRGYHTIIDSADFFSLLDKYEKKDNRAYWSEHALSKQRYFHLLCYSYGKYPAETKSTLTRYYPGALDQFITERGDYCVDDYQETYSAWMGLLQPYLKTPAP